MPHTPEVLGSRVPAVHSSRPCTKTGTRMRHGTCMSRHHHKPMLSLVSPSSPSSILMHPTMLRAPRMSTRHRAAAEAHPCNFTTEWPVGHRCCSARGTHALLWRSAPLLSYPECRQPPSRCPEVLYPCFWGRREKRSAHRPIQLRPSAHASERKPFLLCATLMHRNRHRIRSVPGPKLVMSHPPTSRLPRPATGCQRQLPNRPRPARVNILPLVQPPRCHAGPHRTLRWPQPFHALSPAHRRKRAPTACHAQEALLPPPQQQPRRM